MNIQIYPGERYFHATLFAVHKGEIIFFQHTGKCPYDMDHPGYAPSFQLFAKEASILFFEKYEFWAEELNEYKRLDNKAERAHYNAMKGLI